MLREIYPAFDGTTHEFDVKSLDDLAQFPYLKKVALAFSQDATGVEALEARGITVLREEG